ncbi:MAG TPA: hypothetical protein VNK95_14460 [Caldilineaceae bacterium]|nr:hypothetical protein [Caldilineaceae bacterium]
MSEQENKPPDAGPVNPEGPVDTPDAADDEAPQADPGRWGPLVLGAGLVVVALFWWLSRTPAMPEAPAPAPIAVVATPTPGPEPATATPEPVTEQAAAPPVTEAEAVILVPTVALPTVTPTSAPTEVATRTVSIGGNVTLRLTLETEAFESSGRPVDKPLAPRSYTLGAGALTVADRWCMQVGVANLLFDLTLTLNPATESVRTSGTLHLYDGFCDAPGELLTSTPLDLEVPADASVQAAPSLQTRTQLLGVSDLLNTSTGVFVQLVISNTSPR